MSQQKAQVKPKLPKLTTGQTWKSRRTITLSPAMEARIAVVVGRGNFSAFAQRALAHELQRESIAGWLDERLAARAGSPLDPAAIAFAENAWQTRKSS